MGTGCATVPPGVGMEKTIDAVLAAAERDGRSALYEHEVYAVLAAAGLEVPHHIFVRDPADLGEADLRGFGAALIVKIVSAAIPHKQKLGGVKRVSAADVLYVQFVMGRMKEEVLSHFGPAGDAGAVPPRIDGFLVVEYVPHTEALGYEVLIGLREDPAFGPVLTLSKGGDDAEFFAAQYDPANLFLPPMSLRGRPRAVQQPAHPAQVRADRPPAVPGAHGAGHGRLHHAGRALLAPGEEAPLHLQRAGGEPVRHLPRRAVRGPRRPGGLLPRLGGRCLGPGGECRQPRSVLPPRRRRGDRRVLRHGQVQPGQGDRRASCTTCAAARRPGRPVPGEPARRDGAAGRGRYSLARAQPLRSARKVELAVYAAPAVGAPEFLRSSREPRCAP